MIRAVLDTNILVSALITKKPSAPFQIYKAFTAQKFLLITSPSILAEVEDVINREKIIELHKRTSQERQIIIEQLLTLSYVTLEKIKIEKIIIERDPKDDKFIYAALEGHAEYIITGDDDLLSQKAYENIKILSPNDFLEVLQSNS